MATNKRKDAAALFELIDKSTLKVPKGAGSLKIPSWWSSKTNTAGPAGAAGIGGPSRVGLGTEDEAGGVPEIPTGKTASPTPKTGAGGGAEKREIPDAQHRLFDPPPVGAEDAVSPSIRPPVRPVEPPAETGAPVAAAPSDAVETSIAQTIPESPSFNGTPVDSNGVAAEPEREIPRRESAGYAGSGTGRRVFAPQTASQTDARPNWSPGFKLARAPGWAIVAGGAGIVIVLMLIIFAMLPSGGGANKPQDPKPEADARRGLLPIVPKPETPGGTLVTTTQQFVQQEVLPAGKGRVHEPGTLKRSADQYYIWILSTPKEEIARKNAAFLADNGVGVSLEIKQTSSGGRLWQLISEQGFPTMKAAEPYLKRVREIGHLTPEWKKTRRATDAWDGAFVARVKPAS